MDGEGKRWRVRSPRHPEASTRLETEFMILRAFAPAIRAELPFHVPTVAGTVRQGDLTTFVYAHLQGSTLSIDELSEGSPDLAREIGSALAAIHDLPLALVTNADLPSYSANEFRQRKLNELDQAATTGKIPAVLLRRWEHALEDVALWRFNTSVVHGDLHEDNLMVQHDAVTAVTGWTDLRIGDPADDFAWLVASNEASFIDAVLARYTQVRRESPDPHLLRRAALLAEFALAQYLVKAMAVGHQDMTAEAEGMLQSLAEDIEEQARKEEASRAQAGLPGESLETSSESQAAGTAAATAAPAQPPGGVVPAVSVAAIPAAEAAAVPSDDGAEASKQDEDATSTIPVVAVEAPAEQPAKDDTSTAAINVVTVTPLHTADRA